MKKTARPTKNIKDLLAITSIVMLLLSILIATSGAYTEDEQVTAQTAAIMLLTSLLSIIGIIVINQKNK